MSSNRRQLLVDNVLSLLQGKLGKDRTLTPRGDVGTFASLRSPLNALDMSGALASIFVRSKLSPRPSSPLHIEAGCAAIQLPLFGAKGYRALTLQLL